MRHVVNEWVPSLQLKVERLDTYAGPGQNEVFSSSFAEVRKQLDQIGKVQGSHTRTLARHSKMLTGLRSDVRTLKGDVSALKGDVSTLKGDVSALKSDMGVVKGTLAEILDRLPPKAG